MKEQRKRKLLGERIYKAYRRIRYIRYLKKIRKTESIQANHAKVSGVSPARAKKKKPEPLSYKIYTVYRKFRFLRHKRKSRRAELRRKNAELRLARKKEKELIRQNIRTKELELILNEKAEKQKQQLEKKELRKRRRRLLRFVLKKQLRVYLYNLTHPLQYYRKRIAPGLRSIRENKEKRKSFFVIFTNSTVYFILSYLVINLLGMMVTVWAASQYNYRMILFYYKLYFDIETSEWFGDAVRTLYSAQPLTSLFLGLVFLIVYSNVRREAYAWKLFFLWGFIHGLTMFFGATLMGTLLNKGFGYVLLYMYYSDSSKLIFALTAIFALVSVGTFSVKSIMLSANLYFRELNRENKSFFMISQFFLPVLAGTALLALLKFPDNLYYTTMDYVYFEILKLASIVIVALPVLLSYRTYLDLFFEDTHKPLHLQWKVLIVLGIIALLMRTGLSGGLRIG